MNLQDNQVEFQIVVEGRTVSTHGSQHSAEAAVSYLNENDKSKARIVPVTKGGQQFLLG